MKNLTRTRASLLQGWWERGPKTDLCGTGRSRSRTQGKTGRGPDPWCIRFRTPGSATRARKQ